MCVLSCSSLTNIKIDLQIKTIEVVAMYCKCFFDYISRISRGVTSNEAEEAVASSLFYARTRACIGDII